jgi:hypothetical protein
VSSLFGVGATMMFAIPTIQVRLTGFALDAPPPVMSSSMLQLLEALRPVAVALGEAVAQLLAVGVVDGELGEDARAGVAFVSAAAPDPCDVPPVTAFGWARCGDDHVGVAAGHGGEGAGGGEQPGAGAVVGGDGGGVNARIRRAVKARG